MKLKYYPYTIKLKEEFTLSVGSRKTTPAVIVEVEHNGMTGYGEASLPPYLPETQSSVINFFKKVELNSFDEPAEINLILDYVDKIDDGNYAAKAAVDVALHDLLGKSLNVPLLSYLGIKSRDDIYSSYTIGISDLKKIKQKIEIASEFKYLKVKLGSNRDKEIIRTIREQTEKPLFIDVNQGWKDKYFAYDMICWLAEQNTVLIEQPLPKENFEDMNWLKEKSPLHIIADEAVQILSDLEKIKDYYAGVNIKLMKCGGLRQAWRMMLRAKELNLKIMLGCMTETSCAITAASHLSPLADWVDLDGAELIANDLFAGMRIKNGALVIPAVPGIGVEKRVN